MPVTMNKKEESQDRCYSRLFQQIRLGKFVITGELEPTRSGDLTSLIEEAHNIEPFVNAANVTDNPGSFIALHGLLAANYIQEHSKVESILQLTCRDQNRMALASSLLAAAGVGIKNVLLLTGDHPTLGDIPQSKPVFDLDSLQLLQLAREMVDHQQIYNLPIEDATNHPVQFHIGIGANPNTTHPELELLKIKKKVMLGVDFIQTQVIYDLDVTQHFFQELQKLGVPVLVGIFPMRNYSVARDFNKFVPGVSVPSSILAEFEKIKQSNWNKEEKNKAYDKINQELFKPLIKELKKKGFAAGIHIAAVHYSRIFPLLLS